MSTEVEERLVKLETTTWGAFGNNGLKGDVTRHSQQIGDLYGRDETLRNDVNGRLSTLDQRMSDRLAEIHKLIVTLLLAVLVSAIGIISTLLTQG